ncbi:fructuronate reductase [Puniceibacterium sediminis]|uniref:Fructuronate reductase n=1 Tax=Puniceibacterium sediminis TaxID=1608407 RepID=A0A238V1Z3_9RHOB|nr:mannitol dehydrogenase family protein [Puniceibacterium sediminis]SNR28258.1 fructuronate reductase [Puniceibacterium sediminis]
MPAELPPLSRSDAPRPGVGIVHLGLGAFFRAHGAIYVSESMAKSGGDWGILAASIKSPGTRDSLAPQSYAYTALEAGPDGDTAQVIEVIEDMFVAPEDPAALVTAMADPGVKIVTLTVTEKGYCHNPATGDLNLAHPDIAHDLTDPLPRSAPGFLVRALQARRAAGLRPFTVLTCDNLPHNGSVVRKAVLDLAQAIDPDLAAWIATEGRFPSTMVDRIVPATKPADLDRVAALTGRADAAPVIHEPFRQWVIEDDFVDGLRPDLAAVGVELVTDVAPFELMKLRMLNGTHSSLAYLGYLAGHETISDTVADPVFADFARHLWSTEIIPTLTAPEGTDLNAYADVLLERYKNPAIRHLTWQIAMDGSQKLPQRMLGTLTDATTPCPGLYLAVAGWMRYVGGVDEKGGAIDVRDPLADTLKRLSDGSDAPADKVAALLALRDVFSQQVADKIKAPVTAAYETLLTKGARAAVQEVLK